jgi:hypothetical protein
MVPATVLSEPLEGFERRGAGHGSQRKMLLKVALVLALGSIGLIVLRQAADASDQERLEQAVAAQRQHLRDHLFKR